MTHSTLSHSLHHTRLNRRYHRMSEAVNTAGSMRVMLQGPDAAAVPPDQQREIFASFIPSIDLMTDREKFLTALARNIALGGLDIDSM